MILKVRNSEGSWRFFDNVTEFMWTPMATHQYWYMSVTRQGRNVGEDPYEYVENVFMYQTWGPSGEEILTEFPVSFDYCNHCTPDATERRTVNIAWGDIDGRRMTWAFEDAYLMTDGGKTVEHLR